MSVCINPASRASWNASATGKGKRQRKNVTSLPLLCRYSRKNCTEREQIIRMNGRIRERRDRNTTVFAIASKSEQNENVSVPWSRHRGERVKTFATPADDQASDDAQEMTTRTTTTTKRSTPIVQIVKAVARAFLISLVVVALVVYGARMYFGKPINIPGFSSGFTSGILLFSQRVAMIACMRFVFGNFKKLTAFMRHKNEINSRSSSGISSMVSSSSDERVRIGGYLKKAIARAVGKFKANPRGAMFIPVVAAFVGYITNWLAVKMIFYPVVFWGPALWRALEGSLYGFDVLSPLGALGWQGIVPAKAPRMAFTMVTMVTEKLIDVSQTFLRLSPEDISNLLFTRIPEIAHAVASTLTLNKFPWAMDIAKNAVPTLPGPLLSELHESVVSKYLAGFVVLLQANVDRVIDLKELVVTEMSVDRSVLCELFQRCGRAELKFLTDSGFFFGFLLGLVQMVVWMFYDNPWTLTVGGTIVGYLTNWIALKLIFEPIEPVYFCGFKLQGLFLQRQHEVSGEFSDHLAENVLTSEKIWNNIFTGRKRPEFDHMLETYTKDFVTKEGLERGLDSLGETTTDVQIIQSISAELSKELPKHVEVLHEYTDKTLALKELMRERMELMTPKEFERVLHPIFEEDEMTLIISGAVLGAIAGFLQQIYTVAIESTTTTTTTTTKSSEAAKDEKQ
jgi:uncharacterized membrane protein YheB (UPF0754 family)